MRQTIMYFILFLFNIEVLRVHHHGRLLVHLLVALAEIQQEAQQKAPHPLHVLLQEVIYNN